MNKKLFSHKRAKHLNSFLRRILQNPKRIVAKHVKKGSIVADIGCGPGFFTTEIAKIASKVIAVDLQQEMLDMIKKKDNIELVKCKEDDICVKEKVDLVFAFYVVHEIADIGRFFSQVKAILKKDGRIVVYEPRSHVSKEEFLDEISGFKVVCRCDDWKSWGAELV